MAQDPSLALKVEAKRLARLLSQHDLNLVLAESCTGGMAAAALTQIPGISQHFCGSLVVYQTESKRAWLGVRATTLRRFGPESPEVSLEMARLALKKTPQADLAAAITGDLGPRPDSPQKVGTIFLAVVVRESAFRRLGLKLRQKTKKTTHSASAERPAIPTNQRRIQLQLLASHSLLSMVRSVLKAAKSSDGKS